MKQSFADNELLPVHWVFNVSCGIISTVHTKNQNFEILRLEYLLNTCKYHAKKFFLFFFCDFEHIKTGFRRFKFLVLTVDIKSPICIYYVLSRAFLLVDLNK